MSEDIKTWEEAAKNILLICGLCHLRNNALGQYQNRRYICIYAYVDFAIHKPSLIKERRENVKFNCILSVIKISLNAFSL